MSTTDVVSEFVSKFPKLSEALRGSRIPINVLSQYERILANLETLWGTLEGHTYLENLTMTQRIDRQGFPDPVATELIRLHLLHIKQYPERHHNPHDPFAHIA